MVTAKHALIGLRPGDSLLYDGEDPYAYADRWQLGAFDNTTDAGFSGAGFQIDHVDDEPGDAYGAYVLRVTGGRGSGGGAGAITARAVTVDPVNLTGWSGIQITWRGRKTGIPNPGLIAKSESRLRFGVTTDPDGRSKTPGIDRQQLDTTSQVIFAAETVTLDVSAVTGDRYVAIRSRHDLLTNNSGYSRALIRRIELVR